MMLKPTARSAEENKHELERDHQLVSRIKSGDREACAELVGLYQKKIFVFAYGFFPNREDALEIVQETFMRILAKIDGYQPQQSFSGWVYRLTHNICIDTYRKFAKKRALESNFADVCEKQLAVKDNPLEVLESQQMSAAIARAAERLSLKQKSVFTLKYSQGMKLQQVAEVMNISLGTVKTLHHRALRKIRKEVGAGARGEYGTVS
ncbi:MAG: sigma-70 family RNA polymerase sigma factor [Candidatus Aminicenantes bacterium]|nr:sigma-70 family RNA polymerase sigma factor [Candidatus Aminicenantes bacterium]